jgi:hypothetical protein
MVRHPPVSAAGAVALEEPCKDRGMEDYRLDRRVSQSTVVRFGIFAIHGANLASFRAALGML